MNRNKPDYTVADWNVACQWMCSSLSLHSSDFHHASHGPHLEGPERRGAYIPSLNHRLRLEREQASKPWTEVLKIRSPHCARVGMVCGVRHVRCERMETCSFPSPTSQSGKGGHPQYPKGFHVEQTELRKRQSPGGWPRMRYENQVRIELSS